MTRFLVYDSACVQCSRVAEQARLSSRGSLEVRSLYDPEIRAMLDLAQPGWRFGPMLLEADGERIRVYSGIRMVVVLAAILGIRSAVSLVRRLADDTVAGQSTPPGVSRRVALRRSAVAVAASSSARIFTRVQAAAAASITGSATLVTSQTTLYSLMTNPQVQLAAQTFGAPSWTDVMYIAPAPGGYVLTHPTTDGSVLYTAVGLDGSGVISFRVDVSNGQPTIQWMSPAGDLWATTMISEDGTADTVANPDDASGFARCITTCIGANISTTCAQYCFFCVAPGVGAFARIADCGYCAVCGGARATTCAAACVGYT